MTDQPKPDEDDPWLRPSRRIPFLVVVGTLMLAPAAAVGVLVFQHLVSHPAAGFWKSVGLIVGGAVVYAGAGLCAAVTCMPPKPWRHLLNLLGFATMAASVAGVLGVLAALVVRTLS